MCHYLCFYTTVRLVSMLHLYRIFELRFDLLQRAISLLLAVAVLMEKVAISDVECSGVSIYVLAPTPLCQVAGQGGPRCTLLYRGNTFHALLSTGTHETASL
jgi:hypothetical protein